MRGGASRGCDCTATWRAPGRQTRWLCSHPTLPAPHRLGPSVHALRATPLDASTEASSSGEQERRSVVVHERMLRRQWPSTGACCLFASTQYYLSAVEQLSDPFAAAVAPPRLLHRSLAAGDWLWVAAKWTCASTCLQRIRVTQVLNQPAATPAAAPHRTLNKICMLLCVCAAALRDGPTGDARAARRRRHLSAIGTAVLKSLSALVAAWLQALSRARCVEDFFQNSLTYSHLGGYNRSCGCLPSRCD